MSDNTKLEARANPAARPCPICAAESDIRVGEADGRVLLICPQCRHVYWHERVDYGQTFEHYDSHYSASCRQREIQESNRAYYRTHAAELAGLLAGNAGPAVPPPCVVDFGSSYPVFLDEARASGVVRPVGVDFSADVRQAGAAIGIEMWEPAEFAARFDDGADVMRFSHVIEHLADPVGDVAAAVARLAPGGIAYVTQPIFPVLRAEPASLQFHDAVFPEHLHFFNPVSLALLLRRAGLEIEEFVAFQEEEAVQARYAGHVDLDYVEERLPAGIGDAVGGFSPLGCRPTFFGENCRVVARKPATSAVAPVDAEVPAPRPASPPVVPAERKLHEFYDIIVNTYDETSQVWRDTLTADQKHTISQIFLILAARLSFYSAEARGRIFRDAEQFGVHFLPVDYYSPLPCLKEIDPEIYNRRFDSIPGLTLDPQSHLDWLDKLGRFSAELASVPTEAAADDEAFFWRNPAFAPGDAAIYYGLIRHLKPNTIVEIGASYSSLIALAALRANGSGSLTCIEPNPLPQLRRLADSRKITLRESPVQRIEKELFTSLQPNDILFIDSSHVSKIGSDVNHEIFEILPSLCRGVFCHFHDIFFPWDFNRVWIEDLNAFWNEQYLIMAFLAYNDKFAIEIANQYLERELPDAFRGAFPDLPAEFAPGGGSLWIRAAGNATATPAARRRRRRSEGGQAG